MVREISAGGVLVRRRNGVWWMAAIEPAGQPATATEVSKPAQAGECEAKASARGKGKGNKPVVALPKGLVDPGEAALQTALREVNEETGLVGEFVVKLGDTKYVYTRAWGDGQRVFKIVSFYLLRYLSGRIDDITPAMRIEVARAFWIRLEDAATALAYKGEKQVAGLAAKYLQTHPDF